jgi:hypothetical protein
LLHYIIQDKLSKGLLIYVSAGIAVVATELDGAVDYLGLEVEDP